MRRNSFRVLLTAGVFSLSALLLACPMGRLRVVIPDYVTSEVKGVQVFSVNGSQLVAAGKLEFGTIQKKNDRELLQYTMVTADGARRLGPLYSPVVRDAQKPAQIQVDLGYYNQLSSGNFKVASYNVHGTSKPSANQVFLVGEQS